MDKYHSKVLEYLETFFRKQVDLPKYKAKLIEAELLDEDLIPVSCSPDDWVGHVLRQVRRSGPEAYDKFRDVFEEDAWIQQRMDEELNVIKPPRQKLQRTLSVSLALKSPVEHYVERKSLEEKCLQHLHNNRYIALTGMNGNGKTQLARKLAQKLHKKCGVEGAGVAVEIDCSTEETCLDSIKKLQFYTDIVIPDLTHFHLNSLLQQLTLEFNILIFDNVLTDLSWLQRIKPPSNTYIIITTVNEKLFNGVSVPVGGLNDDETKMLSESLLRTTAVTMEQVKELANEIDANALGLTIAFKHLEVSKTSVTSYVKRLQQGNFPWLIDEKPDEDYPQPLRKVLYLSLSDIDEQLTKQEYRIVFRALAVCAFMNKDDIPLEYIGPVFQYANPDSHYTVNGESMARESVDGHSVVDNVVATIRSHSLGEVTQEGSHRILNVHRAVQIALFEYLKKNDLYEDALNNALLLMTHLCNKDTRFHFEDQLNRVCHVEAVLRCSVTKDSNTLAVILHIWLLVTVGHIYSQMKQPTLADKYIKKALGVFQTKLLDDSICVYKQRKGNRQDVKDTCSKVTRLLQKKSEEVLKDVESFIYSQRLTKKDVNCWKEKDFDIEHLFKDQPGVAEGDIWLSEEIYKELTRNDCAVAIDKVRQFALQELLVSALYTYGRVYFYLKNQEKPEILAKERPHRKAALMLADSLCKVIEEKYEVKLLHSELVLSNGLYYFDIDDGEITQSISNYRCMLENPCEFYELGLLKSDNIYTELMIYRQLVTCYKKLFETNGVGEMMADAHECVTSLESLLEKSTIQAHSQASYYNEIGGLHLVMRNYEDARGAFEHACEIERQSAMINYPWMDAIRGLFKLFENGTVEKTKIEKEIREYKEHVDEVKKKHPHHDYRKEVELLNELIRQISENKSLSRLHSSADNLRKLVKSISLDSEAYPIPESSTEIGEDDAFVDSTSCEPRISSTIDIRSHEERH